VANWPWMWIRTAKSAQKIKEIPHADAERQKMNQFGSGLKIVKLRRVDDMNLKLTKNGIMPKTEDDFRITNIGKTIKAIIAEYNRSIVKNAPFNSTYEGWALIKQKVDGLWEEIKKDNPDNSREVIMKEAAQIGAMAMRFMVDLGNDDQVAKMSQIPGNKRPDYSHFV
jgi:hypothetical protein